MKFVDIPKGMSPLEIKKTGLPIRIKENLGEFNPDVSPRIVKQMVLEAGRVVLSKDLRVIIKDCITIPSASAKTRYSYLLEWLEIATPYNNPDLIKEQSIVDGVITIDQ